MPVIWRRIGVAGAIALASLAIFFSNTNGASDAAAHWSFDEGTGSTSSDSVGGLIGSIAPVDAGTWISDGASGSALHFDGARTVTVADNAVLRSPTIGVQLWVRGDPTSPPTDGQVILEKGDLNCAGGSYALVVDGGHVALRYLEADPATRVQTLTMGTSVLPSLWDGAWHLVSFSSKDDEWGYVFLYQQGWMVGTSPAAHAIVEQTPTNLVVGGPANPSCGGASFKGDIDDVSVYSRLLTRDELAAEEPTVPTSIEVTSVGQLAVDTTTTAQVQISPTPLAPGTVSAWLVGEDGVERGIGSRTFEAAWQLPADGKVSIPIVPEIGGDATLVFKWQPSLPQVASVSASTNVQVAKAPTQANLTLNDADVFIENQPIDFAARISSAARLKIGGQVELYEQGSGGPVLIDTEDAVSPVGSFEAWAQFSLPARNAGTYSFFAKYLGDDSFAPSDAPTQALTVSPALVTGQVEINDGAATTDDPLVTVAVPAVGAVAVQVSTDLNNISRQLVPVPWQPTLNVQLTDPQNGNDQDGLYTVFVRWADDENVWSDWSSDSITLDRGLESGTLSVDGGASATQSNQVTASVPVQDPTRVAHVQLSNDLTNWKTYPYAQTIAWQLSSGDGSRTMYVRWVDAQGRQSVNASDSIMVDSAKPSVSGLNVRLDPSSALGSTIAVDLTWLGSDSGSGVAGYDVQLSRDGKKYSPLASRRTSSSFTLSVATGHSYRARVRAADGVGNLSNWQTTRAFKVSDFQESSGKLTYKGKWSGAKGSSYWHGQTKYSSATGASVTLTFTGSSVAWVSPIGPMRGSARIFVDGVQVAPSPISLWASRNASPAIVFQASGLSSGRHTVRIEVVGTVGHPRVDADGFLVLT